MMQIKRSSRETSFKYRYHSISSKEKFKLRQCDKLLKILITQEGKMREQKTGVFPAIYKPSCDILFVRRL